MLLTFNPSGYSYVHMLQAGFPAVTPLEAVLGVAAADRLVRLPARDADARSALLGMVLALALFAALIWLIVSWGWVKLSNTGAIVWIGLVVLALILAVGMSWSHLYRRWSGQATVEDADDELRWSTVKTRLHRPRHRSEHRARAVAERHASRSWKSSTIPAAPPSSRSTTSNRICLLRQFRHAAGGWIWELPAGKIDNREPPLETARRELEEEAGMRGRLVAPARRLPELARRFYRSRSSVPRHAI